MSKSMYALGSFVSLSYYLEQIRRTQSDLNVSQFFAVVEMTDKNAIFYIRDKQVSLERYRNYHEWDQYKSTKVNKWIHLANPNNKPCGFIIRGKKYDIRHTWWNIVMSVLSRAN